MATHRRAGEDTADWWKNHPETLEQVAMRNRVDIDNHEIILHGDLCDVRNNPGLIRRVETLEKTATSVVDRLTRIEGWVEKTFWLFFASFVSVLTTLGIIAFKFSIFHLANP